MTYYNTNPLFNSGKISGYLIRRVNAGITETEYKKVFLIWGNPKKNKNIWHSLSFLKFNCFQEIDNSGKCFVGIQIDKFGNKRYRIFKTRISNIIKGKDIITYPAISSESYSDIQWLPKERVFKVFNSSGECSVLIPPKWEQCNNVPFNDSKYDPYSLFKYWPNTDFGHFKDFKFYKGVLFGENYDGTLDIISSRGEIMSYAWSDIQISDNGVSFRDNDKNIQEIAFDEIGNYYHKELSERKILLKAALPSTLNKSQDKTQNETKSNPSNGYADSSTTDKRDENIFWLYRNFEKQYDKTVKISRPDDKIVQGEPILCLHKKKNTKLAYIVRYGGRRTKYHPIERAFELTDEVLTLLSSLKSGRLSKSIPYNSQMTNDELIESFKTITLSQCVALPESEIQDNKNNNILTEEIPMTYIPDNKPVSKLMGNEFARKIRQVSNFLSISFPSTKVFECLMLLFEENINNIKDYTPATDALINSTELDLTGEIKKMVNTNKAYYLTSKQLDSFNASVDYHMKVKGKPYMESLEIALGETTGSEKLADYIKSIEAHLKLEQRKREKELTAKILKQILCIKDESANTSYKTELLNLPICINNQIFKIGDIVHKENILGTRLPKKFIRTTDYLLIFLPEAECINNGIYEIRGEGEEGNQIIGQNANGDIVDEKKRKIIITENPSNGLCKIFDEVVCIEEIKTTESMNNKVRNVFYFKLLLSDKKIIEDIKIGLTSLARSAHFC